MKTINLKQAHNPGNDPVLLYKESDPSTHYVYKVESLKNSVSYRVGQYLQHPEVAELCDDADWNVNVSV